MTFVHTDIRGRVSLGELLQPERDCRATLGSHGVVLLEPVMTISDYERSVVANAGIVAALDPRASTTGSEHYANGLMVDRVRDRGAPAHDGWQIAEWARSSAPVLRKARAGDALAPSLGSAPQEISF